MKGGVVEINWHDSKPVLTLDFHPKSGLLATGGSDHDIKLWSLVQCDSRTKVPKVSYISTLTCHGHSVNTLRFSPSGLQIASGADGGELIIWKLHLTDDGESWKMEKRLLHHQKDVLDLQWSADGEYLVSGSVDNLCIIWDANKGCAYQVLDAHLHYVQGVAWDPLGHYIASLSSDRTCRIYAKKMHSKSKGLQKMNFACQHVVAKSEPRKLDDSKAHSAKAHLFHDETLPSFFRRLAWSPDGSFLLVPAGIHKFSFTSETINTAYIFSRKDFSRPAIHLPGANKPIVVIRFCPILFHLRRPCSDGFFKLPYRIVFAVATLNSVFLYDTEGDPPIAIFAGLHYAAITDIAWSYDAKYLAVSSRDCFCTVIQFEDSELGSPWQLSESQISAVESKNQTTSGREIGSSMGVDNIESASSADQIAGMPVFKSPSSINGFTKIGKSGKTCIASVSDESKITSEENKTPTGSEQKVGTSMEVDNGEATSATDKSPSAINESGKINDPGNLRITPVPIESMITSKENKRLSVSEQVVTNKAGKKRITPVAIP